MDEEEFEDKGLLLDEDEDMVDEEEEDPLSMGFHEEMEPESDF